MDKAFRLGLMHEQFDSMTQVERMELRVRRIVDQIMEPEQRRIEEMLIKGSSCRQVESVLPHTEADVTERVLELMELAVTERAHEIDWGQELTPTTLRKVMQEMKKGRRWHPAPTEMEFPYLMPLPLEAPIYELDLAEVCPVCGGAKQRAEGVCGRCFLRGSARPGGRL